VKTWSPPQGLIIQPGSLLVPGRPGYVPEPWGGAALHRFEVDERDPHDCALVSRWLVSGAPRSSGELVARVSAVSIPRWDLSGLTEAELDSLQAAIEAQRQAGIGNPCPATEADRRALTGCGRPRAA
jgi:hypothetical protein